MPKEQTYLQRPLRPQPITTKQLDDMTVIIHVAHIVPACLLPHPLNFEAQAKQIRVPTSSFGKDYTL